MADKEKFPIWKEAYEKMGVTPRELYMRQNRLCELVTEVDHNGDTTLYCTDGKHKAETRKMLNPTIECMHCISGFTEAVISDAIEISKQKDRKDNPSNNS